MVWKPGISGNPGGRPKVLHDVKQLAKEASKDAIDTLIKVMKNDQAPVAARVTAAQAILDRAWGKPSQTIEANINVFDRMSDEELVKFISSGAPGTSASDSCLELEAVKEGVRGEFGQFYTASVERN